MANQDAAATAYRAGLDASADDLRATIQDATAKQKAAKNATRPAVQKAEADYQAGRIKDAKAALAKVEKAIADDDADQAKADAKPAAKATTQKAADAPKAQDKAGA